MFGREKENFLDYKNKIFQSQKSHVFDHVFGQNKTRNNAK